jgi:hypothetical protein
MRISEGVWRLEYCCCVGTGVLPIGMDSPFASAVSSSGARPTEVRARFAVHKCLVVAF